MNQHYVYPWEIIKTECDLDDRRTVKILDIRGHLIKKFTRCDDNDLHFAQYVVDTHNRTFNQ